MNKQAYYKLMLLDNNPDSKLTKKAGINLLKLLKAIPRGTRATGRFLKALGVVTSGAVGLGVSGSLLYSMAYPEAKNPVVSRIMAPFQRALVLIAPKFSQSLAQSFTELHEAKDKEGNIIKKPPVLQSIGEGLKKFITPAIGSSVDKLTLSVRTLADQGGRIGELFGRTLGEGFKATGGKVLTGGGGAALGYTAADFIQDLLQKTPRLNVKQKRRRRIINIISSILGGAAGIASSSKIFKALD